MTMTMTMTGHVLLRSVFILVIWCSSVKTTSGSSLFLRLNRQRTERIKPFIGGYLLENWRSNFQSFRRPYTAYWVSDLHINGNEFTTNKPLWSCHGRDKGSFSWIAGSSGICHQVSDLHINSDEFIANEPLWSCHGKDKGSVSWIVGSSGICHQVHLPTWEVQLECGYDISEETKAQFGTIKTAYRIQGTRSHRIFKPKADQRHHQATNCWSTVSCSLEPSQETFDPQVTPYLWPTYVKYSYFKKVCQE